MTELLTSMLSTAPRKEILDFYEHLTELCVAAYRGDLWSMAALIFEGFCSDDSFLYFRLWLVAQGKTVYEAALADPDSLAAHPPVRVLASKPMRDWVEDGEWPWLESLLYVALYAYEGKTGEDFDEAFDARREDVLRGSEGDPAGEFWDFGDHADIRRRAPRLAELFLHRVT